MSHFQISKCEELKQSISDDHRNSTAWSTAKLCYLVYKRKYLFNIPSNIIKKLKRRCICKEEPNEDSNLREKSSLALKSRSCCLLLAESSPAVFYTMSLEMKYITHRLELIWKQSRNCSWAEPILFFQMNSFHCHVKKRKREVLKYSFLRFQVEAAKQNKTVNWANETMLLILSHSSLG